MNVNNVMAAHSHSFDLLKWMLGRYWRRRYANTTLSVVLEDKVIVTQMEELDCREP
jgi:hypothetical protein